jgi:hypothetical protein
MPCSDSTAFTLKPIKFWSYEKWHVPTPCVNEGFAHAEHVTLGRWHMRRVKDVFDDYYLAGREICCSECRRMKAKLQDELDELKDDLTQVA